MSKSKTEFPSHIIISVSKKFYTTLSHRTGTCVHWVWHQELIRRPYQLSNLVKPHGSMMHTILIEKSFYRIFYNYTSSKFCHISTDPIRVFSRCACMGQWGITNSLTFAEATWSLWSQVREHKSWSRQKYFGTLNQMVAATPQTLNLDWARFYLNCLFYIKFAFLQCYRDLCMVAELAVSHWKQLYFPVEQDRREMSLILNWAFMQDILINQSGTSCLNTYLVDVMSDMYWYGEFINISMIKL